MITVDSTVGRLIEVRFAGAIRPEHMRGMRDVLGRCVVRIAVPVIFVADCRTCEKLSPEVYPMVVGLMRSDNRTLLRSGVLFQEGSEVALQMKDETLMQGARRTFFSPVAMTSWLADVATADELARARKFLAMPA